MCVRASVVRVLVGDKTVAVCETHWDEWHEVFATMDRDYSAS